MKKIITVMLALFAGMVFASNAFAYKANIKNNTGIDIKVKSAGSVIAKVEKNSTKELNVDPGTYMLAYKGKWADQSIGNLQVSGESTYIITPDLPGPGRANMQVYLKAQPSNVEGSINSVQEPDGRVIYTGKFERAPAGGYLMNLGVVQSLDMSITEVKSAPAN